MGGHDYDSHGAKSFTRKQTERVTSGEQSLAYLEKYQITDIVNGIEVTRTKFRLKKRKLNKK